MRVMFRRSGCRDPVLGTRIQAPAARSLLVALRVRIRLHQGGSFIDEVVLAILPRAADTRFAPQMMVLVDADITFRSAVEFDSRRCRRHLVDVEASRFLNGELP